MLCKNISMHTHKGAYILVFIFPYIKSTYIKPRNVLVYTSFLCIKPYYLHVFQRNENTKVRIGINSTGTWQELQMREAEACALQHTYVTHTL